MELREIDIPPDLKAILTKIVDIGPCDSDDECHYCGIWPFDECDPPRKHEADCLYLRICALVPDHLKKLAEIKIDKDDTCPYCLCGFGHYYDCLILFAREYLSTVERQQGE